MKFCSIGTLRKKPTVQGKCEFPNTLHWKDLYTRQAGPQISCVTMNFNLAVEDLKSTRLSETYPQVCIWFPSHLDTAIPASETLPGHLVLDLAPESWHLPGSRFFINGLGFAITWCICQRVRNTSHCSSPSIILVERGTNPGRIATMLLRKLQKWHPTIKKFSHRHKVDRHILCQYCRPIVGQYCKPLSKQSGPEDVPLKRLSTQLQVTLVDTILNFWCINTWRLSTTKSEFGPSKIQCCLHQEWM